jgi:hypothetical protein
VEEAIARQHELDKPMSIKIKRDGKFDEITQYSFDVPRMSPGEARLSV